ncbi:MAG: M28 family peptidase, partial [Luteimonas sp.]
SEHGAVLGTHAQPLALTALGGSPGGTVEGEVVRFESLDALQAAPDGSLAGKIAYVDYRMKPFRDGHDYGVGSKIRTDAPSVAIRKGAIGYVMRSAGTDSHRVPHTGITRFDDGLTPIPSAALAAPDADQLARLLALGPTRIRVALDCGWNGQTKSQNVIGEITGAKTSEVVVIGGHLDSWDLGTGAIDDASGVAITMAAGHLIGKMKQPPLRTIRVIAYANEEQGLFGAKAYAESQTTNIAKHQLIAESDFGAGRIYAFDSNAPDYAKSAVKQIADALAPLGVAYTPGEGDAGSDASASSERGVTWASLSQDGTDYFDLHHTADDTLDKIDAKALAQNVAAYTVFAYLAASADGDFGSAPKAPAPEQP